MTRRLEGKVAIVTGAGSGIGAGIARRLAGPEGAGVVITGRRAGPLQDLAAETGCRACPADVSKREDVQRVINTAVESFGGLDILVVNHGLLTLADFDTTDEDTWARMLATNTVSPFMLAQEAAPHMAARGGGAIVFIASVSAYFAYAPDNAAYSSSKGAVITMTRSLAVELGGRGIRVNCVCPGLVQTPMVDPIFQRVADARGISLDEAYALCGKALPAQRMGRPEDFGGPVAFLVSDDAQWVTGAILNVDGGTTCMNPGIMSVMAQIDPQAS
ncbi:MAG: SDR family oxidoreductase [Gammaproteobacteria bacterium]|nr:SDR family oxidoreductase [Gammaproteobacteria bacterium]